MPKLDNKHSMAEDYLAQIKWRGKNGLRRPKAGWPSWASDEPDWKYQPIIDGGRIAPPLIRFIVIGTFLTAVGYLLYQAIFLHSGLAIYMAVVFLFIGGIIFFAARDASK